MKVVVEAAREEREAHKALAKLSDNQADSYDQMVESKDTTIGILENIIALQQTSAEAGLRLIADLGVLMDTVGREEFADAVAQLITQERLAADEAGGGLGEQEQLPEPE